MRLGAERDGDDDESDDPEFGRFRPPEDRGRLWLFNAFTERRFDRIGWARVKFRKDPLDFDDESDSVPGPLVRGYCKWQRPSTRTLTATLSLSINPTRFVRNCSAANPLPHHLMSLPRLRAAPYGEVSQDGRDNWLPLDKRTQGRMKLYGWRETLGRYLQTIETGFEQELTAACANVGFPGFWERHSREYNLKSLETYWEWGSEDPPFLVKSLGSSLREITHREFRSSWYAKSEWEGLKASHRSEWSPGEFLSIYNKTNRRIRMEVTHNFGASARFQFPSAGRDNRRPSSSHVRHSLDALLDFVGGLSHRAAFIIDEFMSHLRQGLLDNSVSASAYETLFRVARIIEDEGLGLEIIGQLVDAQSLRLPRNDAPERRRAIQLLVKERILVSAGQRHPLLYFPAPYFRNAFRALGREGVISALSASDSR